MKLHIFPPSPNAKKPMMVAAHTGLDIDHVVVDLQKGEQKRPEFLAMNPNGKMPVLELDDGTSLWESNAICNRLASEAQSDLWPSNMQRYEIMQWQFWEMAHWQPNTSQFVAKKFFNPDLDVAPFVEPTQTLAGVLDGHLDMCDIPLGDVPNIDRWMNAIQSLPAWQTVTKMPEPA